MAAPYVGGGVHPRAVESDKPPGQPLLPSLSGHFGTEWLGLGGHSARNWPLNEGRRGMVEACVATSAPCTTLSQRRPPTRSTRPPSSTSARSAGRASRRPPTS